MKLTTNEIIDELRKAVQRIDSPDDVFTASELMRATGWSPVRMSGHLHAIKAQGRLEIVTVWREALNGRNQPVPGYRITAPSKAKKATR